jgi:ParB family chromosome partitioning protein
LSVDVVSLPVDELNLRLLEPSSDPIRKGVGDIEELARSISQFGLLQPLIVRARGPRFEVVAGNRRLAAIRKLKWRKAPCHILELSDKEAFEISLEENLERNNLDPIEEAEAFRKYVETSGWGGISELSQKIGRSTSFVSKRIRLLTLPPPIVAEFLRRRKSLSAAEELLSLEPDEQLTIAKMMSSKELSVREVRRMVKSVKEADPWKSQEVKERLVGRTIDQVISAQRLTLARMDLAIERLDKQWVEKEILMQYRLAVHNQIDSLMRLRKKLRPL